MSEATAIRRDEKGRPVAEDGYPIGGLANATEIATATNLGLSTVYAMFSSGEIPTKAFGRSRRAEWSVVRQMFFSGEEA